MQPGTVVNLNNLRIPSTLVDDGIANTMPPINQAANQTAHEMQNLAAAPSGTPVQSNGKPVWLEPFTAKYSNDGNPTHIIIRGDTKPYRQAIKENGGRFGTWDGKYGWSFSINSHDTAEKVCNSINNGQVQALADNYNNHNNNSSRGNFLSMPNMQTQNGIPTLSQPINVNSTMQEIVWRVFRPSVGDSVKITGKDLAQPVVATVVKVCTNHNSIDEAYVTDANNTSYMLVVARSQWQVWSYTSEHRIWFTAKNNYVQTPTQSTQQSTQTTTPYASNNGQTTQNTTQYSPNNAQTTGQTTQNTTQYSPNNAQTTGQTTQNTTQNPVQYSPNNAQTTGQTTQNTTQNPVQYSPNNAQTTQNLAQYSPNNAQTTGQTTQNPAQYSPNNAQTTQNPAQYSPNNTQNPTQNPVQYSSNNAQTTGQTTQYSPNNAQTTSNNATQNNTVPTDYQVDSSQIQSIMQQINGAAAQQNNQQPQNPVAPAVNNNASTQSYNQQLSGIQGVVSQAIANSDQKELSDMDRAMNDAHDTLNAITN